MATLYASAQTTYFPLWSKENWTLERLEIKLQRNNDLNLGTVKPLMRGTYVRVADSVRLQLDAQAAGFSAVDLYNLNRLQANSSEYSAYPSTAWKSKKPLGKGFFETPGNMLEVNQKGFYMSINPAISVQQSMEKDYDESIHFRAFGASGRG
ncbi:MAG: hypothetical protein IT252_11850, partial [Chitinophagaceae bacterium]|nr:hypothetical protein [Chitinophagaceae bacterium]